jgi:glycosyltransferase involved in cell wall biosynthesis
MRVLLIAEMCNPEHRSEPLVGWNTAISIAAQVEEAVLVTQVRNREAIGRAGEGRFADIVYIDTEYVARPLWRLARALRVGAASSAVLKMVGEIAFERDLWRCFGADIEAGRFDILHRVTPISSAVPCPLAAWSPAPMVLGPINGGLPYPPEYNDLLRKEGEWLRYVRGGWRLLPWADATYRKSAAILAAFPHTIERLPTHCRDRVVDMPENGADPARFRPPDADAEKDTEGHPITFLYAGRLVPFKCVDVAIAALACNEPALAGCRLEIVGDGPERAVLEAQAAAAGLGERVVFRGSLPQAEVARHMAAADAFVFPSVRDSGAGVVVEAMMAGLPVVVMDWGPTHDLLSEDSGLRVPLGARAAHVPGVRAAMARLAADPALRRDLGVGARQRALTLFSWETRARKIVQVYEWVLGRRETAPDFYSTDD